MQALRKGSSKVRYRYPSPHEYLNSDGSATSIKTMTLELIVSIMEEPGPTFLMRSEFREIIRDYLCDSILKNSVSTDKAVFAYSLGTFVALVVSLKYSDYDLLGEQF